MCEDRHRYHLPIIAIAILVVIVGIWWGARAKAARKVSDATLAERNEVIVADPAQANAQPTEAPVPHLPQPAAPTRTPPEPTSERIAAAAESGTPTPATDPVSTPPVAPAPPPLLDAPAPGTTPAAPASYPLTTLKGLGPKVAAQLETLGITRIDQLAALSADDAAALDADLGSFRGRMARDRWIEQATFLARGDVAGYEAAFGRL